MMDTLMFTLIITQEINKRKSLFFKDQSPLSWQATYNNKKSSQEAQIKKIK